MSILLGVRSHGGGCGQGGESRGGRRGVGEGKGIVGECSVED